MRGPDLQLLGNGDILVPEREHGGDWRVRRVVSDDAEYAKWLAAIQERDRQPGLLERGVSFWFGGNLVFFGFWFVVVTLLLLARAL